MATASKALYAMLLAEVIDVGGGRPNIEFMLAPEGSSVLREVAKLIVRSSDTPAQQMRDYPLSELDLQTKTYRVLSRRGVETIGDLVVKSEKQLLAMFDVGPHMVDDIKQALALEGLSLNTVLKD